MMKELTPEQRVLDEMQRLDDVQYTSSGRWNALREFLLMSPTNNCLFCGEPDCNNECLTAHTEEDEPKMVEQFSRAAGMWEKVENQIAKRKIEEYLKNTDRVDFEYLGDFADWLDKEDTSHTEPEDEPVWKPMDIEKNIDRLVLRKDSEK